MTNKYEWINSVRTGNPIAQCLFRFMSSQNFKDNTLYFTIDQYADNCCCSRSSIKRALTLLQEQNLITKLPKNPKYSNNLYTLNVPESKPNQENNDTCIDYDESMVNHIIDEAWVIESYLEDYAVHCDILTVHSEPPPGSQRTPNNIYNYNNNINNIFTNTSSSHEDLQPKFSQKPVKKVKRKKRLDDSFMHNEHHEVIAQELGVNLDEERINFIDYWVSKGEPRADWDRGFNTWLRNAKKFQKSPYTKPLTGWDKFVADIKSKNQGAVYDNNCF